MNKKIQKIPKFVKIFSSKVFMTSLFWNEWIAFRLVVDKFWCDRRAWLHAECVGCVQWVLRRLANFGVWSSLEGILGGFSASRGWLDSTEGPSVTKRFQSWSRVIHLPNHNFVLTRTRTHSARSNSIFIRSCQIKKWGKTKQHKNINNHLRRTESIGLTARLIT